MESKEKLLVIQSCTLDDKYVEDYISLEKMKSIIYSSKFMADYSFLNGRELDFKLPILKVSFDKRFLDKDLLRRRLSSLLKDLEPNKYAVWTIAIGGIQVSFDEFINVFKIINNLRLWKKFLFSIRLEEDLKHKIEIYFLLYE